MKTAKRPKTKKLPTADELLGEGLGPVPSSTTIGQDGEPGSAPVGWHLAVPKWIEPVHAPIEGKDVAPMFLAWITPEQARKWARNPRKNQEAAERLAKAIGIHRFRVPAILDEHGELRAGHTRQLAALALKMPKIPVLVQWFGDARLGEAFSLADNRLGELATWDFPELKDLLVEFDTGEFSDLDARLGWTDAELEDLMTWTPEPATEVIDPGPSDPPKQPVTRPGDLWELGDHRLLCGDSTDPAAWARLMSADEKAALIHADPPYGMGKEAEGIVGDNQHGAELDTFQLRWWSALRPFVADNASAYIWGNAEDLWRLWFVGGLKDIERMTFRNEIAWHKGDNGKSVCVASGRSYYSSERCLFFMLGEQGFNRNADNYWEGWEPIRAYLDGERKKMGWTAADIKRITGVGMFSHWFTRSQWELITEEQYAKLQEAARKHGAFKREHGDLKREHDDLKREFYATRAFFDNTHDAMTDVWSFPRVLGEERFEHATPKPVDLVARAIKSSCPAGGIVAVPFSGTGPEIIACEQSGRKARVMEIQPAYVDVCMQRWEKATGRKAIRLSPSRDPVLVDGRRIDLEVT